LIYTLIFILFAILHLVSFYSKNKTFCLIFKPLTIFSIVVTAFYLSYNNFSYFNILIILGLIFSMIGDIFLLFPEEKFIHGLISFLIAHVLYILALSKYILGIKNILIVLFVLSIYGLLVFNYLKDKLGKYKIAVISYISIIIIMGTLSINYYLVDKSSESISFLYGSVLFIISDTTLAIDKFNKKFYLAQFVILTTYYLAQYLIAISLLK